MNVRCICRSTPVVLLVVFATAKLSFAELIHDPPHSHGPEPIVTWTDGHAPVDIHTHQHRTDHDPQAGVFVHGTSAGAEAYVAWNVWVGRTSLNWLDGGHATLNPETFHGHQHGPPEQSNSPARYHVHTATAGGDISAAEAAEWNANAPTRVFDAFNGIGGEDGWLDVGNASGDRNWPDSDDTTQPGTGVPWHSAINWVAVDGTGPHELHVIYGEAGGDPVGMPPGTQGCGPGGGGEDNDVLGCVWVPPGHSSSVTLVMDDDAPWFWGVDTDDTVEPNEYDAATTLLHEVGHVIGLGHFGDNAGGYIMTGDPQPLRGGGAGGILHVIDDDAIYGVRDIYAISTPEPSGFALALFVFWSICPAVSWRFGRDRPQT